MVKLRSFFGDKALIGEEATESTDWQVTGDFSASFWPLFRPSSGSDSDDSTMRPRHRFFSDKFVLALLEGLTIDSRPLERLFRL